MEWKGKTLITTGDVMNAMQEIVNTGTKEDAAEFMKMARTEGEYASENIGYLTGYFDHKTADKMMEWFDVSHPIFGRGHPSPEEALKKGLEMGERIKNQLEQRS
jgi:hypothetical protein